MVQGNVLFASKSMQEEQLRDGLKGLGQAEDSNILFGTLIQVSCHLMSSRLTVSRLKSSLLYRSSCNLRWSETSQMPLVRRKVSAVSNLGILILSKIYKSFLKYYSPQAGTGRRSSISFRKKCSQITYLFKIYCMMVPRLSLIPHQLCDFCCVIKRIL